jgi:hypothetical protein
MKDCIRGHLRAGVGSNNARDGMKGASPFGTGVVTERIRTSVMLISPPNSECDTAPCIVQVPNTAKLNTPFLLSLTSGKQRLPSPGYL